MKVKVHTRVGKYNVLEPYTDYLVAIFEWPKEAPDEVKKLHSILLWEVEYPEDYMDFDDPVEVIDTYLDRFITTKDRTEFLKKVRRYLVEGVWEG